MMKKYIIGLFSFILLVSCEDFLEEKQVGTLTQQHYETEEGMEDLIRGCYQFLRFKTGYEQCYLLWNFGVDEMTVSDQGDWRYYNSYDAPLNSEAPYLNDLWSFNYRAINNCNTAIEKIPKVTDALGFLKDDEGKARRLSEVRFLRGYYYFMLVQQFGAIPISVEPVKSLILEWPRKPVSEVYDVIISDFRYAAANLPETQSDYGRTTKNAARHYAAKAYLTRGSAVTEERGQKATDMDSAAYYADLCINSGYNSLLNNYKDIWDPNNQTNEEIIFATQFDTDPANITGSGIGYQNRAHLFWLNQYDTEPGMERNIAYGRPYRRLMVTDYAVDIHDRLNDSRLRKALLEVFYNTNWDPKLMDALWTEEELAFAFDNVAADNSWAVKENGDTAYVGGYKFGLASQIPGDGRGSVILGDTALVFLVNDETTTLTDREIVAKGYTMYVRYYWRTDNAGNPVELMTENSTIDDPAVPGSIEIKVWTYGKEPSLYKYIDTERSGHQDEKGTRDLFNARLGETYLIAAEAYGRAGNYATAVERLNTLRRRAAYHEGEARPDFWWQFDGGTQGNTSGTEANMELTASYWDNDVPLEHYPEGVSTREDRFVHFMLNERCRELLGEMVRWEDLVRTETLVQRAYAFNPDVAAASSLQEHHKYRPIPREHIELIQIDGNTLTPEQRSEYQNPGY